MDERWGAELMAGLVQWQVSVPVLLSMECGDHQVRGLTTESLHLVVALSARAFVIPQVEPEMLNPPPSTLHPPPSTVSPKAPNLNQAVVAPQVSDRRECEATLRRSFPPGLVGQFLRRLHVAPPPAGARVIQVLRRGIFASLCTPVPHFHASGSLCVRA